MSDFRTDLASLINSHSKENGSNTPDYILADYLADCLDVFDRALKRRGDWYVGASTSDAVEQPEPPRGPEAKMPDSIDPVGVLSEDGT